MECLFLLCLTGIFAATAEIAHSADVVPKQTGTIVADRLHLRETPDPTSRSLDVLRKGNVVEIREIKDGWLKVVSGSLSGYVRDRDSYVRLNPPLETVLNPSAADNTDRQAAAMTVRSKTIGKEIKRHQAEVLSFTRQESELVDSLNEIDLSVNQHRKQVAALKSELQSIDKKIETHIRDTATLKKEIAENERYVSKRLVALYKLNWFGKIHILASADSMYELFQRKVGLDQVLRYDDKVRQGMFSKQRRLDRALVELKLQKKEKTVLEAEYRKTLKNMSHEKDRKGNLLASIRNKKSLELAAIDALKKSARALDLKIETLRIEKKVTQKAKKTEQTPFKQLKGLLNMPVKGKVITRFGRFINTRFNISNFRSGIDIRADRGEPVHAVSSGRILYASWFKGYSNMVIIDHGRHYYTVYAHTEEVFKSKGDPVDAHEVIATVGDSGSLKGPGLYFEVRHRGKPLNPLDWIKKG